jgi:uncharacterized protein YigA (DUF484 family)
VNRIRKRMALPLKVAYFVVERAAEPLSLRIEQAAESSPRFRDLCSKIATWVHTIDERKQQRRVAHQQRLAEQHGLHAVPGRASAMPADEFEVPEPLSEKEAVEKGADLLGEGVVISIGFAILLHQWVQDARDDAENELRVTTNEARIAGLESERARIAQLELENERLRHRVLALESQGTLLQTLKRLVGYSCASCGPGRDPLLAPRRASEDQ